MADKQDAEINCRICGMVWNPEDDQEAAEIMAHHTMMYHPLDLLRSRKFQKRVASAMEDLGGRFADYLKGALHGKS